MDRDRISKSQVEKLTQIGIALTSETNLEKLLGLIVAEARAFTGADAGSLYILDDGKLYFHVAQNETLNSRPSPPPGFKPYPLPLSEESIAGYIAITGEILNIEDVYHLPESVPYDFNPEYDVRNDYLTKSMLVVPMKDREGQVLGVLQLINAMNESRTVVAFPRSVEGLAMSLASQAAVAIRNARLVADIKALFEALIRYSASAIDARSPHTAGHSRRVAAYCKAIAEAINAEYNGPLAGICFTAEQMEELTYAAWLHDIGKIGVPESILDKTNRFSDEAMEVIRNRFDLIKALTVNRIWASTYAADAGDAGQSSKDLVIQQARQVEQALDADLRLIEEANQARLLSDQDLDRLQAVASTTYEDMAGNTLPYLTEKETRRLSVKSGNLTEEEQWLLRAHVEKTYDIVKNIPFIKGLKNVPLFSRSHHELLDGTGYPRGLKGKEIPIQSRIIAVADIFDALTAVDRPYRRAISPKEAGTNLVAEAKAGRLDKDIVELFLRRELYNI